MRRYAAGFIVLAAVAFASAPLAAQQTRNGSPRPATLSERLQQFRQDLMGEPVEEMQQPPQQQQSPRMAASPNQRKTVTATPARPLAPTAAAKSAGAGTTASNDSPSQSSGAVSSRRTAQPDYRAAQRSEPSPTPAAEPAPAEPIRAAKPSLQDRLSNARSVMEDEAPIEPVAQASDEPEASDNEPTPAKSPEPKSTLKKPITRSTTSSDSDENVLFTAQSPLLAVEASGPKKVLIGKEAIFTVKVHNAGEVSASHVVVAVNIPGFVEVVAAQPSTGGTHSPTGGDHSEPLEWKINRLEAHARETLTLKLVPRKSLPIDLAVQWTCSPEVSQTLVDVQEPKLLMALAGPGEVLYGQSKVYKLTISNPGNGDAENVVVSLLPIGRTSESTASHRLGTVKAGESKAIEVELTARQPGSVTIKAQASGDGGLRAEASETVLVRRPALQVEVLGPKVKYAGTAGTYRVRLVNSGNATAENVQLVVSLPPDSKYVNSSSGGRLDEKQGRVAWNCGAMQAEAERIFEVQCNLLSPGDNRVQVGATAEGEISAVGMATTRVEALADLKLEVRDPQGPVPVGEDAVYEVVIRNRGTKNAEGINVVAFFSEGLEATAVQGGPHEIAPGQVMFKTIGSIAAGSESVFRIFAQADRSGNHIFRAEVTCQSLGTKLAAEEATHFYGEETAAEAAPAEESRSAGRYEQAPARR